MTTPRCGDCNAIMVLTTRRNRLDDNSNAQRFYSCTRFPLCRGALGAHPDGSPMGTPADSATRRMRHRAHVEMDALLKHRPTWGKLGIYHYIASKMGLTAKQCHFGLFNSSQCKLAISIMERCTPRGRGHQGKRKRFIEEE